MPFVPDQQNQAPTPGFKPDAAPDAASKAAQGGSPKAQAEYNTPFAQQKRQAMLGEVESHTPALVQSMALGGLMKPAGSALGRIGQGAGIGGAFGARGSLDQNESPGDVAKGAGLGAFLGGGVSAAGEGLSAGANKLADYFQQKAVGMRKSFPGVGNNLVDQGVWGTKNHMADQVEEKLAEQEAQLQDTVKGLSGTVNSKEIADAVSQKAQRFTLPDKGTASPFSQAELNKVRSTAAELSKMGDLSASDLLALKRQGDYQGYTAGGNPATSTESELGRTGAEAARAALKKMSPDIADSLFSESALIKANGPLNKPETIHQGVGSSAFFGKLPGQSLGFSTAAHGLQRGVAPATGAASNPLVLQGLFSNQPQK